MRQARKAYGGGIHLDKLPRRRHVAVPRDRPSSDTESRVQSVRRASRTALAWSGLFWIPAGVIVASAALGTVPWRAGYGDEVVHFILGKAGVGYCFFITAIACGVGYPIAQQRSPVLPSGFKHSQIFAAIVYTGTLVAGLPLQAVLSASRGSDTGGGAQDAAIILVKIAAAIVTGTLIYPWSLRRSTLESRPKE